jgi:rod shape-determining protein MreC
MVEESNKAAWIVLFSALAFHLLLVSLPAERSPATNLARSVLMDLLTPAQKLVDRGIDSVGSVWTGYVMLVDAQEKSERLEAELDELRMQIQRDREAVIANERYRRIFALSPHVADFVVARVTGGDPSFGQRTVTLDKGRGAGIEPALAVRTPEGVIGRVLYAAHASAIVQLITDPASTVGALVEDSRVQGRVRGNGTDMLIFEHSEDEVPLRPGQVLVTSGSERIYPPGLPIGVITASVEVNDLVSTALVAPAADLRRLEEVIVLLRAVPEPGESPDAGDAVESPAG